MCSGTSAARSFATGCGSTGPHISRRKKTAVIGYIGPDGGPGYSLMHQDNHVGKATYQATKNIKVIGFFEDASKVEPETKRKSHAGLPIHL